MTAPTAETSLLPGFDRVLKRASLEDIVNEPEALEVIQLIADGYWHEFETIRHVLAPLPEDCKVKFLLDFDVLWEYMHGDVSLKSQLDRYSVDFLIKFAESPFSLPIGAFQELQTHLVRFGHADALKWESEGLISDPHGATVRIARQLGLPFDSSGFDVSHTRSEVERTLDSHLFFLSRLFNVLSSDRFEGVETHHLYEHYQGWLEAISLQSREGLRDYRDSRDATNLAVASTSWQKSHSAKYVYILVSQTNAVLRANRAPEIAFQMRESFGFPLAEFNKPFCIHPRSAMLLELLGNGRSKAASETRARQYSKLFQRLSSLVEQQLRRANAQGHKKTAIINAFGGYLEEDQQELLSDLKQVGKAFAGSVNDDMRRLEEYRATADSLRLTQQLAVSSVPDDITRIESKCVLFLHLVHCISSSLSDVPEAQCHVIEDHHSSEGNLKFSVRASGDNRDLVLNGVIQLQPQSRTYLGVEVSWPTVCLPEHIVRLLGRLFNDNVKAKAENKPKLQRVDGRAPRHGVYVLYNNDQFYMSIESARGDGRWLALDMNRLSALLREAIEPGYFSGPAGRVWAPIPDKIEIASPVGILSLDINCPTGLPRRYVYLSSRFNISAQIAKAYECTNNGTAIVASESLQRVLDGILGGLPSPAGETW